eukprot:GHVQ01006605.1.p1 GENE.GHVQ01006605.1~~GHVQ01006605.1.p1  ORF type:complete len:152 (-),score=7.10 GHVQ01006605.1:236-691(-)
MSVAKLWWAVSHAKEGGLFILTGHGQSTVEQFLMSCLLANVLLIIHTRIVNEIQPLDDDKRISKRVWRGTQVLYSITLAALAIAVACMGKGLGQCIRDKRSLAGVVKNLLVYVGFNFLAINTYLAQFDPKCNEPPRNRQHIYYRVKDKNKK